MFYDKLLQKKYKFFLITKLHHMAKVMINILFFFISDEANFKYHNLSCAKHIEIEREGSKKKLFIFHI